MDSIPIDRSFTLTRHVNASRSLAFQAWTDPDHLAKWFLNPDHPPPAEPIVVDLRVGGTWRLIMVHDAESAKPQRIDLRSESDPSIDVR